MEMTNLGVRRWVLTMMDHQVDFYLFSIAEELGVALGETEEYDGVTRYKVRTYVIYNNREDALRDRKVHEARASTGEEPCREHFYCCREMMFWTRAGGRVNLLMMEKDGNLRQLDRTGQEIILLREKAEESLKLRYRAAAVE